MTADVVVTKPAPNFAFMAQHLFTAILWVDENLTITWLNAQAEQLLATSSGRLLGQSILALLTPKTSTSTFKSPSKIISKPIAILTILKKQRMPLAP